MRLTAKELAEYQWPQQDDTIVFDDDIAGLVCALAAAGALGFFSTPSGRAPRA